MRNPVLSRFAKIFGWIVLALLIACGPHFLVSPAMAQHSHGGGGSWHGGGGWHDGGGWRGGGGWYGGVGLGWWGWPYYLDSPYYPYAYYPPPVYQAPAVIAQAPAPAAAQASSWYYCANPKGYYPYVQSCQGAWQAVPAVPPGAQH
jgi:hypothetical protein